MATIKVIIKWLYGISLITSGLGLTFSVSFLGGLLLMSSGLIVLPATLKIIEKIIGKQFTKPIKYLMVFSTVFVGILLVSKEQISQENEKVQQEQEAFEKLPQNLKDSINLSKTKQDSLDRIQLEAKRLVNEQKVRKEKIEMQFSSWDGSHPGLTNLIKENMNDPDSYEHIKTKFRDDGNSILVITEFRGKNAFGGKVKNTVSGRVDFNGNVIEVLSQN